MSALVPFPTQVVSLRYARSGFEAIPKDLSRAELLRYFTYSEQDHQQIFQCRGEHNQIGFALLLSGVRLTGRFPHDFDMLPRRFLQHVCQQLKLSAPLFPNYPQREPTRREHIARLRECLGLRSSRPFRRRSIRTPVRESLEPAVLLKSCSQLPDEPTHAANGVLSGSLLWLTTVHGRKLSLRLAQCL
jgi:hypothetical protein